MNLGDPNEFAWTYMSMKLGNKKDTNILRLFQHTFGTHPEQPLPTGYKGIPFIVG